MNLTTINEIIYGIEIDTIVDIDDALYFPSRIVVLNKTLDKKQQPVVNFKNQLRTTYKLALDPTSTSLVVSKSDFGQAETVVTDKKELTSFMESLINLISTTNNGCDCDSD
jgi:hypothetical protein